MPYELHKRGDQWCVYKKGASKPIKGGCHDTREQGLRHMRALYVNVPEARMMSNLILPAFMFAESFEDDNNIVWIDAMPARVWQTYEYGEVPVTVDKLHNFVRNFKSGVRGQEVATDYNHGRDVAKGDKASGWIRDMKVEDDRLKIAVEFTEIAKDEIQQKEWQYFSLDWEDRWQNPETGVVHDDVVMGGGLTNRPIAKGLIPINFSELFAEKASAPYGNVTYADPGYRADKKKRYPLDTASHIRAAWSYINMPKNSKFYSSSQLASIKSKIKAAMKRIGAAVKQMSEDEWTLSEKELVDVPEETLEGPQAEVPELAHSEPGTNVDPATEQTGDTGGNLGDRQDTPPAGEDGTVPNRSDTVTNEGGEDVKDNELDVKLREVLGLAPEADIVKVVGDLKETVKPLETVATQMSEQRKFAELFPEQARELEESRKERVDTRAKKFAESFGKLRFKMSDDEAEKPTKGYSALVLEKIESTHKKFSEGSASVEDFEDVLKTIAEKGVVDFEEHGSTGTDDLLTGSDNPRIHFAELVKREIDTNESLKDKSQQQAFAEACELVARKNPDLAQAYRNYKPAA